MHAPGVAVRPLHQITGEAEFNEVFFNDVRIPADRMMGSEGDGWKVAITTLMNERTAIGGAVSRRGSGSIGVLVDLWKAREPMSGDAEAVLGTLLGTLFMAFHSAQGPKLGLSQMIQSRAQFGYLGALLPIVAVLFVTIGYGVFDTVLGGEPGQPGQLLGSQGVIVHSRR